MATTWRISAETCLHEVGSGSVLWDKIETQKRSSDGRTYFHHHCTAPSTQSPSFTCALFPYTTLFRSASSRVARSHFLGGILQFRSGLVLKSLLYREVRSSACCMQYGNDLEDLRRNLSP